MRQLCQSTRIKVKRLIMSTLTTVSSKKEVLAQTRMAASLANKAQKDLLLKTKNDAINAYIAKEVQEKIIAKRLAAKKRAKNRAEKVSFLHSIKFDGCVISELSDANLTTIVSTEKLRAKKVEKGTLTDAELVRLISSINKIENKSISNVYKTLKNILAKGVNLSSLTSNEVELKGLATDLLGGCKFPDFKTFASKIEKRDFYSFTDGLNILKAINPNTAAKLLKRAALQQKRENKKAAK